MCSDLYEEDRVASAGALVEFGRGCGTIEVGRHKMAFKIREGRDRRVREAGYEDVLVFVLPDGQVLGAR